MKKEELNDLYACIAIPGGGALVSIILLRIFGYG